MPIYQAAPQPLKGEGILARLGRFMTPKSGVDAAQMMVNPVGTVMPGMLSESRLVPTLLKILREKGLDPARAETMLLDAATAGKIDPSQFKLVFDALRKVGGRSPQAAGAEFAAGTRAMPGLSQQVPKVPSSIAPAGAVVGQANQINTPQVAMQPVSEMVRILKKKFQGGQQ